MLQYLVNVTTNTFVGAIFAAMLLAALVQQGLRLKPILIIALVLGGISSLTYAVLKRTTGIAVREYYDLAVLLPILAISLPLLVMFWWSPRALALRWLQSGCYALLLGCIVAQTLPNIWLYPFEFDVGMGSIYNTDYLAKVTGYLLTLAVMSLLFGMVYLVSKRLPLRYVLFICSAMLLMYFAQNAVNLLQILVARHWISRQPWMMKVIFFAIGHINLFIYGFSALTLALVAGLYFKVQAVSFVGKNPAQIRKLKAEHIVSRRQALTAFAGLTFSLLTVTRGRYLFEKGVELSPAKEVFANDGQILLNLEEINDGNLHRFAYTASSGVKVRFIVIKKSESAYGVGLDACDICGASGYYQRGNQVVCILCDVVMNIATIGFPGGCNPVPLRFTIHEGQMSIMAVHLEAEKRRFS